MTDKDRKAFAECMAGLQEIFTPEKPLSKIKIDMYFKFFKSWDIDRFKTACLQVLNVKTISTFPLPAEIKQATITDKSLLAWIQATKAAASIGYQRSVVFPDKVIHSVIEVMGEWQRFCLTPTSEHIWLQKEFERLYNMFQNRSEADHPDQLTGRDTDIIVIPGSEKLKEIK